MVDDWALADSLCGVEVEAGLVGQVLVVRGAVEVLLDVHLENFLRDVLSAILFMDSVEARGFLVVGAGDGEQRADSRLLLSFQGGSFF